ncbi:MAG TPA: hypothetical protein VHJ34_10595 [Actinomycetota bacterium]|nr:hypothetical protein [Actinomycetota bacterium]
MPRHEYLTLADELIEYADTLAEYFEARGYRVRVEHSELNYPFTPTMECRRSSTTLIVELDVEIRLSRVEEWVRYARSCPRDTGVAIGLPHWATPTLKLETRLRDLGVGFYQIERDRAVELAPPRDLALRLELPDPMNLPRKVKQALGPAYDQFQRAQWREGFEDACKALETEARRYLKRGLRQGSIQILDSRGRTRHVSEDAIDRMTIGRLQETFVAIQNQTRTDAVLADALAKINRERVGVVHHKTRTEPMLRRYVGQHIWTIVAALRALAERSR